MNSNKPCPICGDGTLNARSIQEETVYKGVTEFTPLLFSVCSVCGSEQADAEQVRANKRTMIAFKKKVDGLLSGSEVKAIRVRYGMTQQQAANIFGGGPVAFSKYETDDVMQSEAMDKLLRVVQKFSIALAWLANETEEYALGNRILSERLFQMKQNSEKLIKNKPPTYMNTVRSSESVLANFGMVGAVNDSEYAMVVG